MKKILIIDDDPVFLKTISHTLESAGYSVVHAVDGEEGLKAINKEKPNMIVLDIVMPKLGGIDFLKKLKEEDENFSTPILVVSNFSGVSKVEEGMKLGIRGYVVKSDESLQTILNNIEIIIGKANS